MVPVDVVASLGEARADAIRRAELCVVESWFVIAIRLARVGDGLT